MSMVRMVLKCGCRETASYPGLRKWVALSPEEREAITKRVVDAHKCPKPKKPAPPTSTVPQRP